MGSELEIGIKIRKVVIFSIRRGYRSASQHPFLVGFLGFLLLLYRYFPFLFSVLVSVSPVLFCTAVLLGTLLSFGQPNIPEVEQEENVTHGIASFQRGFSEGETVVAHRDESYFVKGYSEHRSDVEESGIEEASLVGEKDNRSEEDRGLLSDSQLDDENLQDIQPEKKQVEREVKREFHGIELGKNKEVNEENLRSEVVSSDEEAIEKHYVLVQKVDDEILEFENEKISGDARGSFMGDQMDCSASSSWKKVENSDYEDDSVESGSDDAESSSPDASMADIMPMLDELHPLLDQDAPQPAHLSRDDSDSASEKSQQSDDDSVESDEDNENHGEVEEHGGDERDYEEEEEMERGKEDESKSAIKWTEDDQKNLLDLGTLELERNQRLENLIARRRARRLMAEKNLIDFDSADIPCNVAPIAVRRNPFDFPDDSYAGMGLPPIPGSAPSILQPRRNPFDIPYDSNEEKPDLKGDSFQQEFTQFVQKDTFFRRHESFSMGPSVLGISKQERHDISWKPVFISERMASEGTSYPSFQRQSSEASDSKLSSVPDTESVSSGDQDERKFSEQELSQETELTSNMDHLSDVVEHGSQSSGENDSVELINVDESSVHHDEGEIVLGGVEDPSEMELYTETGEVGIHEHFNAGETHLRREPSDEVSSSSSSRSSRSLQSEVIDGIPDENMEQTANSQQEDSHLPESRISRQASLEGSNFQNESGDVEDILHVEPVYDSSPSAAENLHSFPSVSSDFATEFSERALPPVLEVTSDVVDKEHNHRLEDNTSSHEETEAASSELRLEVKNETEAASSEQINQHMVTADELSAAVPNFVSHNGSTMAEILVAPVSVDSNLSSDIESVKGVSNSGLVHGHDLADHMSADSEVLLQDNVDSPDSNYQMASEKSYEHLSDYESVDEGAQSNVVSRFDNANMSESVQDADEMPNLEAYDGYHTPSNGLSMPSEHDLQHSLVAGQAPVIHPNFPSEETEHVEQISSNNEGISPIQQDEVLLSRSMEQGNTEIHQGLDKDIVSFAPDSQHETDVKSPSNLENHLSSSDKSVGAQSSSDHDEIQNSDAIRVELAQDVDTSSGGVGESRNAIDNTPLNISSVNSEKFGTPEFSSPTSEVDSEVDRHEEVENDDQNKAQENLVPSAEGYMSQETEETISEFDDMKEIDEEFLSELDTVGDFNVTDAGVSLHTDIVHEKTGDAQLSSLPEDVTIAEVEQDIPVLEARSLEDINLAFKQLQEGVDVKEAILPSSTEDQLVSEESKDHRDVNSDLRVIEARSLEDANVALEKISEDNQEELPKPLDLKDTSVKIEAKEVDSEKMVESFDVATNVEEISRTPEENLENVPTSSSSNKEKSHSRKSSSSSSSSSSDSD